ncbi:MAG: DsbA family oxidoreductase [Burkholderiaceae bacterium]|nr:DsbA family oxidoreductase [Burkholderiaceae bacterium]
MTDARPDEAQAPRSAENQPAAAADDALTIDVVSDVVCPWCYIGKRHLDEALARWRARHPDGPAPRVAWHPFQLNPTMPPQGIERAEYLRAKFGDPRGGPGYERVREAAESAGLEFHPERILRQPNTLRAHALIRAAAGSELQHRLAASLFEGYFVEGRDIGDEATLPACAAALRMPQQAVDTALGSEALEATSAVDSGLRDAGIGGVPHFVIGKRISVSGARGADRLLEAIEAIDACQPS